MKRFTFSSNRTVKSAEFNRIKSNRIESYPPRFQRKSITNFITERINDSSPSELIFLCISSVLKKLLDNLAEIESAIAAFDSAHDFLKSRDATRNHKRIPLLESELSVRFIEQHPEERMRQEARRNDEALPFVADVNRE